MTETGTSSKQALLDCAARLFLEKGFDAVSMDQVRVAAAVSNGSLYHHFPSKAHLARSVYLSALEAYQRAMMDALSPGTPAKDGVRALVKSHTDWVVRFPRQALVLERLRPLASVNGQAPDWHGVNAEAFSLLKSWIAVQVARGDLKKLPFPVWLALVLGPSMQLSQGWALQERPSIEPDIAEALADAAWHSVKAPTPAKGTQ